MGKNQVGRFNDDDYFAEPNYDDLTDEQLDELYYFGELRSASKKKNAVRKRAKNKKKPQLFTESDDDWLNLEFDDVDDYYDDD